MDNGNSRIDQSRADENFAVAAPSISLPKGGGAISGIGEKFAANPVTGTASLTVPIYTSQGRSGFGPQLSLTYDSGSGNGPFGFGWSLSVPSITRKTDKGLPKYQDHDESDVFVLSGAEDLVPVLVETGGEWQRETLPARAVSGKHYQIQRYRPRIEGLFVRIERWSNSADPSDVHWRSISGGNILTIYGKDTGSRIADPENPQRIFSWLICETRDDKGNAILYDYKPEDGIGVDLTRAHERNRGKENDFRRAANRYLKRIRYGNRIPLLDVVTKQRPPTLSAVQIQDTDWMFEAVFDYDEHDADVPDPDGADPWSYRDDSFSTYRAGFEVRTTRLCQRVLMFHHFPDEDGVGNDCLVRSTDFTYSHEQDPASARNPVYTFLVAVTQTGYRRQNGGYLKRSLPPVEYEYTQPVVQDTVHDVDAAAGNENLPIGLDGSSYQWADLHGEGISGILTEQTDAWLYKRNISPSSDRPVEFGPLERIATRPNVPLAGKQGQFMDLAGDGQPDLVVLDSPTPGLYEHDGDESWQPFRPFSSRLNRNTRDPNLKFVDLDGDGRADVLISEDDAFVWHPSLAEVGFGPALRVQQAIDEESGPRMVFADGTQSIYLADLSGDGLTDLVRIRNGEICYWPNLGYCRFGAKISMDHAPQFDHPDQFDHQRLRLADIDGTGTTDIIYLHGDGVRLYFNQSGNGFSDPQILSVFPRMDELVSIVPVDLFGNGTACLVWSSPLPGDARRPMRYVNLMGGRKPHLLVKTANNLGAETRVQYAPSTKFYLQDKRDGKPWITRLPFPVHVVERVETYDHISRNRFVTSHAYHHGYFDEEEREFRGFGMVEQWDTEEVAALTGDGALPEPTNIDSASHVPPVLTRTWFHTGVYLGRTHLSDFFAGLLDQHDIGEYFREPGLTDAQARVLLLPDTVLPAVLTPQEEREAARSLKGVMLRQEVYALDATPKATLPYTVTEQNFTIRGVQPRSGSRHAVFFTHPRQAITYHYERNSADPRIQHGLTLEVDEFGNVLKQAAIGYGRRQPDGALPLQVDRDKQTQMLITYTENRVSNAIDDAAVHPDAHRTPLSCETRTYELTGIRPQNSAARFSFDEWARNAFALPALAAEIPYEQTADNASKQKRLIEHVRTLYRKDDLSALLPLGEVEPLAVPGESYKLAFTPGLLAQVFQRDGQALLPDPASVLGGQSGDQGGYMTSQDLKTTGNFPNSDADDHWWLPAGRVFLSPDSSHTAAQERAFAELHFFLPHRFRDRFHTNAVRTEGVVSYDGYNLLLLETRDALNNRVTVGERLPNGDIHPAVRGNDYRVLQPRSVMDPNRNRTQLAFDTLGMVVGTAVMGKPEEFSGDALDGFDPDLSEADALNHLADPLADPHAILGRATTRLVYDLFAFERSKSQPNPQPTAVYVLARETHATDLQAGQQTIIQHSFSYSDGFSREIQKKVQAEPGPLVEDGPMTNPRWVGSGWTIFNNKGNPVRQYEPFFSNSHRFEFGVEIGVSPVLFYDPVDRVVASLRPNHTYEKIIFGPWQQTTWDANDTVLGDPRTDIDIRGYTAGYFARLPASPPAVPWETWHEQRQGGALGLHEQGAASKAAAHADTPTTASLDTLGRPFLTVAHNRFEREGIVIDEKNVTRVELDIEGNQRAVRDAIEQNGDPQGRIVMRYAFDMLSNRIHQLSMEAGARWMLNDVTGKPISAWNSRGHIFRTDYDPLRRPRRTKVTGADPADPNQELLTERLVYGEQHPEAEERNLRGALYLYLDQAGAVTTEANDYKGNPLRASRRIAREFKKALDWSAVDVTLPDSATDTFDPATLEATLVPLMEAGDTYISLTTYDALNRVVTLTSPHTPAMSASVIRPGYNEANLLERLDVNLLGEQESGQPKWTPFVTNINYDAKGQRQRIDYGNGASTFYQYDASTFRLTQLYTHRGAAFTSDCANPQPPPPTIAAPDDPPEGIACGLQNLRYTYDPVGNVVHIRDAAQQTVYFRNKRVEPSADHTYDANYQLIRATGREHLGQSGAPAPHSHNDAPRAGLLHPGDGNAMGTYIESYVYDAVGNILRMQHRGNDSVHPGWIRNYVYEEASLIEPAKQNNRLSRTTIGNGIPTIENYAHDEHGNITRMPHLGGANPEANLHWDYRDKLRESGLGGGGTAFYTYDGAGQRIRKVWEKSNTLVEERIYLGGFEVYRRRQGAERLERETLHIMDDQQRIALVETRTVDTAGSDPAAPQLSRYQFSNHLNSVGLELDDQALIISYEEYTPYGSTSYQAVRSQTDVPKRYRYTGKERDEESGLYYCKARYYAAWLGRWTAADPAGLIDGANLYRYSRNNPVVFDDPNGTDPPPRSSRYSLGDFRLSLANPISDPLAHASYFDLAIPGLFGAAFNALDLGNRTTNPTGTGLLNALEFGATGLLFYGPTVLSHEVGGHIGAAQRFGGSSSLSSFTWFSGSASGAPGLTATQRLAVSAAGANQQQSNAAATYNRVSQFGSFTPQDAWAYFLNQAGTGAYALRTLTLTNPPPQDDINNYSGGSASWSVEGIATAGTLTALPALAGLLLSGYQFIFNNERSIEVPGLDIGDARLSFPNTQTVLTVSGAVLGASSMLTLGDGGPSLLLGVDVRPTSNFGLALSGRAYGLHVPGTRVQINPYLRITAADPPGVFGGVELGFDAFQWLTISGSIEGSVNDLRGETEGRNGGFRARGTAILSF